ncbi:hypothetical protein A4R44_09235 [Amycolatopsis sp. M39]|nr:hypothetical protein A4R44_09235 [Amycolatopsis sp. M39]
MPEMPIETGDLAKPGGSSEAVRAAKAVRA